MSIYTTTFSYIPLKTQHKIFNLLKAFFKACANHAPDVKMYCLTEARLTWVKTLHTNMTNEFEIHVSTCMMTACVDVNDKRSCHTNTKNEAGHYNHTDLPFSVEPFAQAASTAYRPTLQNIFSRIKHILFENSNNFFFMDCVNLEVSFQI